MRNRFYLVFDGILYHIMNRETHKCFRSTIDRPLAEMWVAELNRNNWR